LARFWAEIIKNEVFLTFWVIFLTDTVIDTTVRETFTTDTVIETTVKMTFTTDTVIDTTVTMTFTTDTVIEITVTMTFTTDTIIETTVRMTFTTDTINDTTDTAVHFPGFWTGQRTEIRRRGTLGSYCSRLRADARPGHLRLEGLQRLEQCHFPHGHIGKSEWVRQTLLSASKE
jgi:hypothetical protein